MMTADAPPPSLWLHSRPFDLAWHVLVPVLLTAGLLAASAAIGDRGPFLTYMFVSSVIGLPHNMLTWLLIMPAPSRRHYERGALMVPALLTALVLGPAVCFTGTAEFAWVLSAVTLVAYHHVTRQHMGLLHSCDMRYVQTTGDGTIRAASKELRWLLGASFAMVMAWKLVGPPLQIGYAVNPMTFTFYPLPLFVPIVLSVVTAVLTARVGWAFWRRHRAGAVFPASHAAIALPAIATMVIGFSVPADQFYLTLGIVAGHHNLQYFAYCYGHHHLRAMADPEATDLYSRWARERRWSRWFATPVLLTVGFLGAISFLAPKWQIVMTMGFMTSHYFIEANIWRRKFYPLMARFGSGRVGVTPPPITEPQLAA